jgi:hypothetical protein
MCIAAMDLVNERRGAGGAGYGCATDVDQSFQPTALQSIPPKLLSTRFEPDHVLETRLTIQRAATINPGQYKR